jgi:biopolymer transport protein ExbB
MTASIDAVIGSVALVLIVMSVWSWTVIFNKFARARRLQRTSRILIDTYWSAPSAQEARKRLAASDRMGYLQAIAEAADSPLAAPGSLAASVPTDDQITRNLRIALLDAKTDLETGLTALATIGNTAPFVGLFGTVWSIFNALVGIEGEGPVMINQVAGPVGEALIMTAAGLFVAIPAVIAYNALVRSNRVVLAELDGFARDLQAMPR